MTILKYVNIMPHILAISFIFQGYSVDCVLLCGTATALLSNSFPTPSQAASGFHKVLQLVLNHGKPFHNICAEFIGRFHVLRPAQQLRIYRDGSLV